MKKFICTMLYVIMSFGICASFSAGALVRVYYPDGTQKLVGQSVAKTETQYGNGSYKPIENRRTSSAQKTQASQKPAPTPESKQEEDLPVTMYAPDGRTIAVQKEETGDYKKVGWYNEPVIVMYASDGRSLVVKHSEIQAYKDVGWFEEPVITVYAEDGRTTVIKKSELDAYLDAGWYKSPADIPKSVPIGTKMVALTFDDGPSKYTPEILDCLEDNGAKATFFVVGYNVKTHPSALKRAHDLDMEIGSHTMNHKNLKKLEADGVKAELKDASDAIVAVTGEKPTLIRPPYGNYNSTVSSVADAPLIMWSVDTLDWKTKNIDSTVNAVLNNVKDGSIVLMHDLYSQSAEAAVRVIPELKARGYQLVTVSELAQSKGIILENGKAYSSIK